MGGEKLSLISGISTDTGRIAARSGVGALMGSKKLKAVCFRGSKKIPVANKDKIAAIRRQFLELQGRESLFRLSLRW